MKRPCINIIALFIAMTVILAGCSYAGDGTNVLPADATPTSAQTATDASDVTTEPSEDKENKLEESVSTPAPEMTTESTVDPTTVPSITPTEAIAPTATPEPTMAPEPTETPMPTVTPLPTSTPKPTEKPWPQPTQFPIPTPGPTPSIRQIGKTEQPKISYHVYECGEKGEEVLELVKALQEDHPSWIEMDVIEELESKYDYSEQDILYGVYNNDWKEDCLGRAKWRIEDGAFSRPRLLWFMNTDYKNIEEDLVYAVDNCGADWNQEAVETLERLLYGPHSSGTSYTYAVQYMKEVYFTDEQIEYAFHALGEIDWEEQMRKKSKMYLEEFKAGASPYLLLCRLVDSHDFDYDMAVEYVDSLMDKVDWDEQAYLMVKYFSPHKKTREEVLWALAVNGFTKEQAEKAATRYGWK